MEREQNVRPGGTYPGTEQLYRQILKLGADVEEIKAGVRAIRRQLGAEAADRRASNEGENDA